VRTPPKVVQQGDKTNNTNANEPAQRCARAAGAHHQQRAGAPLLRRASHTSNIGLLPLAPALSAAVAPPPSIDISTTTQSGRVNRRHHHQQQGVRRSRTTQFFFALGFVAAGRRAGSGARRGERRALAAAVVGGGAAQQPPGVFGVDAAAVSRPRRPATVRRRRRRARQSQLLLRRARHGRRRPAVGSGGLRWDGAGLLAGEEAACAPELAPADANMKPSSMSGVVGGLPWRCGCRRSRVRIDGHLGVANRIIRTIEVSSWFKHVCY